MNIRSQPNYYSRVFDRTQVRWNQLEGDPELAAPWKQLFGQVQSPRHVVSELLQNADDVGATQIKTLIYDNVFLFEHDGKDFNDEEFASLCRFAFSNKTKLHTIGFRGIGFKSTFSLGETVNVFTTTLAVSFHKQRFTLPIWIENAPLCDITRISVNIQDSNRKKELEKNLKEWTVNPASLLFFNSIRKLSIGNISLQKQEIGKGPTLNSHKVSLTGRDSYEVMVFVSKEEQFPQDTIDEIRQERNLEDLHLPSCHVELVLGLPNEQRIYVVLPTDVMPEIPFSCNAPFLQDPARSGIKAPSTSPTNRWLLHRLGQLAGEAMLDWLNNKSLGLDERAKAYGLLPPKNYDYDALKADVTSAICQGFTDVINNRPFILTSSGKLVHPKKCISAPLQIYDIWTPEQMLQVFGNGEKCVLSREINEDFRKKLESWGFIFIIPIENIIKQLNTHRPIPKPNEFVNILNLWNFIQQNIGYDYFGNKSRQLSIVPVKGEISLHSSNNVVRLPAKKEFISDNAWAFLLGLVDIVDPEWLKFTYTLEKRIEKGENIGKPTIQLLRDLGLNSPSDTGTIMKNACKRLFTRKSINLNDCIQITHLMAALDAKTPEEFYFVSRDNILRKRDEKTIATLDPYVEELVPKEWAITHLLNDNYFKDFIACSFQHWKDWMQLEKSGIWPFAPLYQRRERIWFRDKLSRFLQSRNVNPPKFYPYVTNEFFLNDYDFDDCFITYWGNLFKTDVSAWAKVVQCIINSSQWYWQNHIEANITQIATTSSESRVHTDSIPAVWIIRLRSLPCLYDNYGKARNPAELYLRNPETEPLLGVEPFVKPDLDTESTKPLLRLLGVQETPADLGKLVERLRALSKASNPVTVLSEVLKWYGALDRALVRADTIKIEKIRNDFTNEALILTTEGKWAKIPEVFVFTSEDYPVVPTIHSAASNLSLWVHLGVANHPTADIILEWLSGLTTDQTLDEETFRRVSSALQRYPTQIWQTSHHWLALDKIWRHVDSLKFRLTMQSLTKYADLFPAVKANCANLQMLTSALCDSQPFVSLPELATKIEYRLTKQPFKYVDSSQKPKWLITLGQYLKRIKLTDESQKQHIHEIAERFETSIWLTFDKSDSVEVTPYIDNTPVGTPQSRKILWYYKHIFIKEGSLAKYYNDIVSELARPFGNDLIIEAIKVCINRDDDFIIDYLSENFKLEDEIITKFSIYKNSEIKEEKEEDLDEEEDSDEKELSVVTNVPHEEKNSELLSNVDVRESDIIEDETKHQHKRELTLFEKFAFSEGFRWDDNRKRFIHPDGSWIEHSFPPFQWKLKNISMRIETDYWVSQQCLTRTGVEIPSGLWSQIQYYPQTSSLILEDEAGNPKEFSGKKILQMSNSKRIELYPSKYRIKIIENTL